MEEHLAIKPEGMKLPEINPPGKIRITFRVDKNVIEWFRQQVELRGGGNYQTMINQALREHIHNRQTPLERLLRRVSREEIRKMWLQF